MRQAEYRKTKVIAFGAWLATMVLSMPLTSYFLNGTLEWKYPSQRELGTADAIVVLGGGFIPKNTVRFEAEPTLSSLRRCFHAAKAFQASEQPLVIICGGATERTTPDDTEAGVMRNTMVMLGVPDNKIILETSSKNTWENAGGAAQIIHEHGCERVVLVTHARHMLRAESCFQKRGMTVTPFPVGHVATELPSLVHRWFIPTPGALIGSNDAMREWVGIALYRYRGWT